MYAHTCTLTSSTHLYTHVHTQNTHAHTHIPYIYARTVHMYAHTCTHLHTCMHTCTHMYTCIGTLTHVCTCTHGTHARTQYTCVCSHAPMVHIYAHTRAHGTHVHVHTWHACMHTHVLTVQIHAPADVRAHPCFEACATQACVLAHLSPILYQISDAIGAM